ncbi:MAG: pyruvate formate lyase II activase [Parcubacteria group bacterium ADurb.Bin159]|jgi:pyruvate formate lyase activating enzyme|nr:MAG: pyruvate formate lyase II activase [Parcubacteria group bacterium ADurb.Bin159]
MLNIHGWQKESLIEWPGKVVSVIWLSGCNFSCPWCANQDLVKHQENLPFYRENEVLNYLKTNHFLEGLVITGGEPLINQRLKIKNQKRESKAKSQNDESKNELVRFIKKVKKLGLLVGIETNGSNPEAIEKLNRKKLVDFWAMDIKAPLDPRKYQKLTGEGKVNIDKIKKSIKLILNFRGEAEFRTTIIPKYLEKKDILEIVKTLQNLSDSQIIEKPYVLQQFKPELAKGNWLKPYSPEEIKIIAKLCQKYIKNIKLRL